MPIDTSELKTRSGHPVLRAEFSGEVTVEEARRYHASVCPGGPYELHGHLVLGKVTDLSSDVRQVLGSRKPDPHNPVPVAMLFSSTLVRMVAGLVMRLMGDVKSETFKKEADALAWLDGELIRFHARRAETAKPASGNAG
ncbi:MAG: hypothetical protein AMXMBFR34_20970 [Myxococcaceae bacterium]